MIKYKPGDVILYHDINSLTGIKSLFIMIVINTDRGYVVQGMVDINYKIKHNIRMYYKSDLNGTTIEYD